MRAELIGRDEEIAKLRQALAKASQGRGQMVSLIGEAGVGKSRLVAELRAFALTPDDDRPIPLWLEGGVNGFYPIERVAGMDAVALRHQYGRELRLMGGIDKRAMAAGPEAIDAELAHVAPLMAEGGFIPWCDHHVPPDVSLENYQYYVRRLQEASQDPEGFAATVESTWDPLTAV